MNISTIALALIDNGGRRSDVDRRQFSYTDHIPDRRFRQDRRSSIDRRNGGERRSVINRRNNMVAELRFEDMRKGIDRRFCAERRAAFVAALAI